MAQRPFRFTPSSFVPNDVARAFGQKIAEDPIQEDMRKDPALGSPGGDLWIDMSNNDSDDNMIFFMALRNNLPTVRFNDMLDYRHRRGAYAGEPGDHWARPDAVCHTRAAREYYEIKPMSAAGINAATNESRGKFGKIDKFISKFALPYVRGVKYLPVGVKRKEILTNNPQFTANRQILLTMFGLSNIRVFLIWERPDAALILYMVEIVVETNDNRTLQDSAMRDLARYVVKLIIQLSVPGTKLVTPPAGKITVELPEEVLEFKATVEGSAGGLVFDAVPGETHLLVIEESGFKAIIERQRSLPAFLRSSGSMFKTEEWRRVLRQAAAEEAQVRDRAILIVGAVMMAGVALYVCWPLIAAGAVTVTTAGTTASDVLLTESLTAQAAPQLLGQSARWVGGTRIAGAGTRIAGAGTRVAGAGTRIPGAATRVAEAETQIARAAPRIGLRTRIAIDAGADVELADVGTHAVQTAVRSRAALQSASGASAVFAFPPPLYTFSSLDANAAEPIARLGVALPTSINFSPTWLLRPITLPGVSLAGTPTTPLNFGDVVDPAMFAGLNIVFRDPNQPAPPSQKLRLIGKVTFT